MGLKPCPFCGKIPGMKYPIQIGGGDERCGYNFTMSIICECGASMEESSHQNNGGWCDDSGQAKNKVIEKWNSRRSEMDHHDAADYIHIKYYYDSAKQRIAELESRVRLLEIENWYYEVSELVQYNWWFELIEDVSEVGKEELVKIFKRAAEEAGIEIDV